jgi:putative chitinase
MGSMTDYVTRARAPRFVRTYDANDWLRLLMELGVGGITAGQWAEAFADEVQPSRFSAGMQDLTAWLAQVLHETGMLRNLVENLDYRAERIAQVWPSRFADAQAAAPYAHNPDKLAEKVYGGRMGNEMPGDGARFIGRGLVQHTGRASYRRLSIMTGQDYENIPQLLEQKRYACEAAILYWESAMPDLFLSDQVKVRRRVNGGTIGLEHCQALYDLTCKVMA